MQTMRQFIMLPAWKSSSLLHAVVNRTKPIFAPEARCVPGARARGEPLSCARPSSIKRHVLMRFFAPNAAASVWPIPHCALGKLAQPGTHSSSRDYPCQDLACRPGIERASERVQIGSPFIMISSRGRRYYACCRCVQAQRPTRRRHR